MVEFIRSDLEFILEQILIAEAGGVDGSNLINVLPNVQVPMGPQDRQRRVQQSGCCVRTSSGQPTTSSRA